MQPRLPAIAALLFSTLLTAQDRPLIGRVLGMDRQPLAGAQVTVAWNPAGEPELAPAGHGEAITDARGYFKANAPSATILFVWSTGPVDQDGKAQLAGPVRSVVGQSRLELQSTRLAASERLVFRGLAAWQQHGPFRVRMHPVGAVDLPVELPIGEDGTVRLPPLHCDKSMGELLLASGETLLPLRDLADDGQVPPPRALPVEAQDPQGKPVAGVAILHRSSELYYGNAGDSGTSWRRTRWRLVATTGADGKAEAMLPLPSDPLADSRDRYLVLRARKDGAADSHSGVMSKRPFVDGKQLEPDAKVTVLRFVVAPAAPLRGKVRWPGTGEGKDRLLVRWISKNAYENGWTHIPRFDVAEVAGDGTFALGSLPLDAYELTFHAAPRAQDGKGPRLPLALPPSPSRPADELELAAGSWAQLTVTATDPTGAPAAAAIGALGGTASSFDLDPPVLTFPFDARGSARLWLPKGRWMLAIATEQGYAHAFAEVDGQDAGCTLQQQAFDELRGQVVDGDGKALAGARLQVENTHVHGSSGEEARALDLLAQLAESRMSQDTDAEGRFCLRFLGRPNRHVQLRANLDERKSELFLLEASSEPLRVIVR